MGAFSQVSRVLESRDFEVRIDHFACFSGNGIRCPNSVDA